MGPRGGGEHGATPTSSLLGPERRERNGQRDMKERKKRCGETEGNRERGIK